MEVKRLRTLGLEVVKTLNNLSPAFMEEMFHKTRWLRHRPNNIKVNVDKTAKYHDKSLKTLGSLFGIHSQNISKQKLTLINSENI